MEIRMKTEGSCKKRDKVGFLDRINPKIILLAFLSSVFLLISTIAFAIPNTLTLQGKLTNPSSVSQQGTFTFMFRIYDIPGFSKYNLTQNITLANGSLAEANITYINYTNILWEQNQSITTDANGVYDVILTGLNISFAEQLYLGITIGSDNESVPRINLTSSPYSFRANVSEGLNENNSYIVTNLSVTGNATIGTGGTTLEISTQGFNLTKIGNVNIAFNLSVAGNTLFVDSLNNRVGINASNPAQTLTVYGTLNVSVPNGIINNSLFVASTGRVGIGRSDGLGALLEVVRNDTSSGGSSPIIAVRNPNMRTGYSYAWLSAFAGDVEGRLISDGIASYIPTENASFVGTATNHMFGFLTNNVVRGVIDTSGNFGIGTTSPDTKLKVAGDINATGTVWALGLNLSTLSTSAAGWTDDGNSIRLTTATDSVGIGTANPDNKLTISENELTANAILHLNASDSFNTSVVNAITLDHTLKNPANSTGGIGVSILFRATDNASQLESIGNISAILYNSTNGSELGALTFSTRGADTGDDSGGHLAERLRIDGYGKIGINTTVPSDTLHVAGTSRLFGISGTGLFVDKNSNVGIGTTNPSHKLDIYGNVSIKGNLSIDSNLSVDGATFFVDSSLNRVGIGTSIPYNELVVIGSVGVSGSLNASSINTTGGATFVTSGLGNVTFDADTLFVDSTNNRIGIGNTIPNNTLDVSGNANITGKLSIGSLSVDSLSINSLNVSGETKLATSSGKVGINTTAPAQTLTVQGTLNVSNPGRTSDLFVASSGNVGIGTSSPYNTLTVVGSVGLSGSLNASSMNTTGGAYFATSTGNVGIGTANPSQKLHITGGNILQSVTTGPIVKGNVSDSALLDLPASVYIAGKYAYVASYNSNKLSIIDVSDPTTPTIIGNVSGISGARGVFVAGKFAYVASLTGNSLKIVDISNITKPIIAGSITTGAQPTQVYVSGKYAYVVTQGNEFFVIDVSAPAAPHITSSITDATLLTLGDSVYVQGMYAYVAARNSNRLTIVDVSNPYNASVAGSVQDDTNLNGIRSVYARGRYVYATSILGARISIIDVLNSTSPVIVSSLLDNVQLNGSDVLTVAGKYAYVATSSNRTTIVDISNATNPVIVSSIKDSDNLKGAMGIYVSGKYAYVTTSTGDGLTILDVPGLDVPLVSAGAAEIGQLAVSENAVVGNDLFVKSGLVVGVNGILSQGPLSAPTIGINVTNPSQTLQVLGTLNVTSQTGREGDLFVASSGNVGIGTTSPTQKLTVIGSINATGNITAGSATIVLDSTNNRIGIGTTLPSHTLDVYGNASIKGNLSVDSNVSIDGSTFFVDSLGNRIGIGTTAPSETLTVIGNANISGYLNISGDLIVNKQFNVSSSGDVSVANNLRLGGLANITGKANITGDLDVRGSSITLGDATTDTIYAQGYFGTHLIPVDNAKDLGSASNYWRFGFIDELNVNNISAANIEIGGTSSSTFTIHSNYTGDDAVDVNLVFERGSPIINAVLKWDSTNKRFDMNFPLFIESENNLTVDTNTLYVDGNVNRVGIGTTTPQNKLEVIGDVTVAGTLNASSINTTGSAYFAVNSGNVGIGIGNTTQKLHLNGGNFLQTINGSLTQSGAVNLGSTTGVAVYVAGDYAYVGTAANSNGNEFSIIDISNKTSETSINAKNISGIDMGAVINDLKIAGSYAYLAVGTAGNGFMIVDISNASAPKNVSGIDFDGSALSVFVTGRYAYLGLSNVGTNFRIIDISNPINPMQVGQTVTGNSINSVFVQGKYAYLGMTQHGGTEFKVIDVSNPSAPFQAGDFEIGAQNIISVYVSGKYAYTGTSNGDFIVLDISNPTQPLNISDTQAGAGINSIYVAGKYAYVTLNSVSGYDLKVYDVSNPSAPINVAGFDASSQSFGVFVQGRYLYFVQDQGNEFRIIDLQGIDSPAATIGAVDTSYLTVQDNARIENNLYVGTGAVVGAGGLLSQGPLSAPTIGINVTNPSQTLQVLGTLNVTSQTGREGDLFVASSGNVGINTTSPTSKFHSIGTANITKGLTSFAVTNDRNIVIHLE